MNLYDRMGKPIDLETWAELQEDLEYKRVRETTLWDRTWISTVWLGIDHNWLDVGPPLIFETIVFQGELSECDMARYSTEEQAIVGHEQMVRKWTRVN